MARFLLVHGSNHGGWCWRAVVAELARLGHGAATVDLPSVAADPAALSGVRLDDDAAAIRAALDAPSVLVGHSAAGYAVSRAADRARDSIRALVYLCAYVPSPGATVSDLARAAPGRPLEGALEIDRIHRAYRFRDAALDANLYDDCPAEAVGFARPRLGWQAIGPQAETAPPPPPGLAVHYVICTRDRTIPPAQQADMARSLAGATVHALDTGHSPFFAAPARLAALLGAIAAAL